MNNLDHLNWRYATKKFDPSKKISEAEIRDIEEVLRLAPSSFGLQPWKFIFVNDPALRQALRPHSWNQPQVTDASHLVVLCCLRNIDEAHVKEFIAETARTHGVTEDSFTRYQKVILDFMQKLSPHQVHEWLSNQVYLALGMLLAECAHRRIDACPMEGFEAQKYDELLGLEKQNLRTVVLCPVGYRSADDKTASLKKVRYDASKIISRI